jgi:hypothetical protein
MNPLVTLKEKMKKKPVIEERERVEIIIKGNKPARKVREEREDEKVDDKLDDKLVEGPVIEMKTDQVFDKQDLLKRLAESKKLKVTTKPILEATEERRVIEPLPIGEPTQMVKKLEAKKRILIESEEEEMDKEGQEQKEEGQEQKEEGQKEEEDKKKVKFAEQAIIPIKVPKKKTRITGKVEKGIAVLGPETIVDIGDTDLRRRLPKKLPNVIVKVSSYYMNNREMFVNFINSLFEPYKQELLENRENISCDVIGKTSSNFSLLTHQKIVRDYMNLYTPYRGLLLYHGLGSGKCHAKGTPIMMSNGTIKLVENIQVGDLLMGDDSTPRKVMSLARGRDQMYDIIPVKGDTYRVNQEHILCLRASGFPKICQRYSIYQRYSVCQKNHNKNTHYIVQWIENNQFQSKTFTFHAEKKNEDQIKEEATLFYREILNKPDTYDNVIEISVKDYLKLSNKKKGVLKGYKVPIEFDKKDVPIDPYRIGYWLGDDSSATSEITSQDSGVFQHFANEIGANEIGANEIGANGAYNNVFLNTLKNLDMIDNKHIPHIYKCNSRENRLELLAGFLDSNGSLNTQKNEFEFTQKNETLMNDVIYLARSLGFSCYKLKKKTSNVHIGGCGLEKIPTKIFRKKTNEKQQQK